MMDYYKLLVTAEAELRKLSRAAKEERVCGDTTVEMEGFYVIDTCGESEFKGVAGLGIALSLGNRTYSYRFMMNGSELVGVQIVNGCLHNPYGYVVFVESGDNSMEDVRKCIMKATKADAINLYNTPVYYEAYCEEGEDEPEEWDDEADLYVPKAYKASDSREWRVVFREGVREEIKRKDDGHYDEYLPYHVSRALDTLANYYGGE